MLNKNVEKREMKFNPFHKQWIAWCYLTDDVEVTEIGYGGGANGGKTWLGCSWITIMSLRYPRTRWGIGRKQLKELKITTIKTLMKLFRRWEIVHKRDYKFDQNAMVITFANGSEIVFIDLAFQPSDPEFHRLGSLELTGAWIDESAEVRARAVQILRTRVNRCGNVRSTCCNREAIKDETTGIYYCEECKKECNIFKITAKVLETFNPDKGHVYFEFFKPYKNTQEGKPGGLPSHRVFIPSLITDNPHATEEEIMQLRRADKATRERLLFGNFEYDDDPAKLFSRDVISDLFSRIVDPPRIRNADGFEEDAIYTKYLSVDVSRKGKDTTRIGVWRGWQLKRVITVCREDYAKSKKTPTEFLRDLVIQLETEEGVRRSNVVVDEDGVGGGLVDALPGCRGFVNNSSPIQPRHAKKDKGRKRNYANLKTQCTFHFARLAEEGKVGIDEVDEATRETIFEDLEQFKQDKIDNDGKIYLVSKDVMKEKLGRSPDIGDMMIMRALFDLKPARTFAMANLG